MIVNFTSKNFICELCDFKCSKKGDYNRHLLTAKHKRCKMVGQNTSNHISCICGKQYKHRQSLYTHQKKCNFEIENEIISEENGENSEFNSETNSKITNQTKVKILNVIY